MISLFKTYWDESDIEAVNASVRRGSFWAEGPNIELFERALSKYLDIPYILVCNSGTSALHLAMIACGIMQGDEVIVPSFTFIATANCVRFVGAEPVFADIDDRTYCLSVKTAEKCITPKTKAIIAVRYAGKQYDMQALKALEHRHNLLLIEDGAEGLPDVGSVADCAILSFCQNKIVSTGEGGAFITSNKALYDTARLVRSHGRDAETGEFTTLGYNFRMPDMNAALGISQLAKAYQLIKMRRQVATYYQEGLSGLDVKLPPEGVYQLYTVRFRGFAIREKVRHHLAEYGIASKVYFEPVHLSPYYHSQTRLPVTERVSKEVLSLPMYPHLGKAEIEYICAKIKEVV